VSLQQTAIQQTWMSNNLPENIPVANTSASTDARRMSEPCHTLTDRKSPPPRPASVTLSPLKGTVSSSELHPNQAVVLDEVGEGEMVENKLVIPDEMVHYLNQVADNQNNDFSTAMSWSESNQNNTAQKPLASPSQALPSPSNLSQILPSPPSNLNQALPSPQSTNVLSPAGIMPSPNSLNQVMPSPSTNLNQMMPSPASNMNQMMPSPASNMNHMMPSPAGNFNQIMPSPSSNFGGIQNPMLSPAPSMNQMVPSPASNMNQMIPSPMSVRCHSQLMSPGTSQMPMQSPNPQVVPAELQHDAATQSSDAKRRDFAQQSNGAAEPVLQQNHEPRNVLRPARGDVGQQSNPSVPQPEHDAPTERSSHYLSFAKYQQRLQLQATNAS
jgi:hypothetical protein